MTILSFYLLFGLIVHKAVWEILKWRRPNAPKKSEESVAPHLSVIKAVKIGILVGLIVQTIIPDVFPISQNPFLIRVVGVAIYTVGLLIAIIARFQLDNNWSDIESAQLLPGQKVISHGIYGYIRHPIYVGDLLLLFGLELSLNSWLVLGVCLLAPIVLLQAAREEKKLVKILPGYEVYCANTKRFIPFVI